jgi:hypothetical protein
MNSLTNNRLIIVDRGSATSDTLDIFNAETQQLLFKSSEPQLGGLSKAFRFIGGAYGEMAGVDYSICDAASGTPVMRVCRAGRMIGLTPPFEIFDGAGSLLARFKKCFSLMGNKWRFTNEKKEKLFDMSVKQRAGFVLSVRSLAYDILVEGKTLVSIAPYKEEGGPKYDGKRVRLLEFDPLTEGETSRRLLLLGVGLSLDRIVRPNNT